MSRVLHRCQQDGDQRVQFTDFCMAMNRTMRGSMEQRLQFVFELFGEPDPETKGTLSPPHHKATFVVMLACRLSLARFLWPLTTWLRDGTCRCVVWGRLQSCAWESVTW